MRFLAPPTRPLGRSRAGGGDVSLGGVDAGPSRHPRKRPAPRSRRDARRAARPPARPDPRDRAPGRSPARRLGLGALGRGGCRRQPARPRESIVAGVSRPSASAPGCGSSAGTRGDPAGPHPGALRGRARRIRGRASGRFARETGRPSRRDARLSEPDLHAHDGPRAVGDPCGRAAGSDGRQGAGDQDRGRRHRRRPVEPVPRARRLLVPSRLPEGRHEAHDAEGDRRSRLPGAGPRQAEQPGFRPDRAPRHARLRHRGRRRGNERAGGTRPPRDGEPLRRRPAGLDRQLPRLHGADAVRSRGRHARDHQRVRVGGDRRDERDQLLGRRSRRRIRRTTP